MTRVLGGRTLPCMTTTTTELPTTTPAPPVHRGAIDLDETSRAPAGGSIWTVTRVIALAFTVLETVLLARFGLLLFGANAGQPLVSFVYGVTDPLVRPFQGIFGQPPTVDVAALLAVVFFLLMGALLVAGARAVTKRAGE
jgi:YggT family protein